MKKLFISIVLATSFIAASERKTNEEGVAFLPNQSFDAVYKAYEVFFKNSEFNKGFQEFLKERKEKSISKSNNYAANNENLILTSLSIRHQLSVNPLSSNTMTYSLYSHEIPCCAFANSLLLLYRMQSLYILDESCIDKTTGLLKNSNLVCFMSNDLIDSSIPHVVSTWIDTIKSNYPKNSE